MLFVTKFEELTFDAVRSLLALRDAALDHVIFLNVIERERVAMRRGSGYMKDEEIRLRERANIRFIDWAENLFVEGMEVGVYIAVGSLVSKVIDAAENEDADLIVIGRPHKGVLESFYSGSDVTELLRRAAIPVLVYKHMTEGTLVPEKPFERVVLAADWSPASLRAVELLKPLKNVIQEIHVVHVVGDDELTGTNAMDIQKTRKDRRQKLDKICEIFETEGITAEPHVYIGDTEEEIEKAAKEHQASMIVMGSSGKPSFAERWLGSTPQRIAEKSIYPTLLVPPEKKQP